MKRLVVSSQAITNGIKSNSNIGRSYLNLSKNTDDSWNTPDRSRRDISSSCSKRSKENNTDDFEKPHKRTGRLNLYWSLDNNDKRKVSDCSYIKQAVQETFMQRAQGSYSYRRNTCNPTNSKTTNVENEKPQITEKIQPSFKPDKTPIFPNMDVQSSNVQTVEKNKLEISKRLKNLINNAGISQDQNQDYVRSGATQLEAVKKKWYGDSRPPILQYMIKKNEQNRQLKQSTVQQPTKFGKKISNLKKKSEVRTVDDISITPRAIEVRKPGNKATTPKNIRDVLGVKDSVGKKNTKRKYLIKKSIKLKEKNPTKTRDTKSKKALMEVKRDRESILRKIKSPITSNTTNYSNVNIHKKNLELTPQIYPKGSLTLRKSFLPISPCRQVALRSKSSEKSLGPPKNLDEVESGPKGVKGAPSLANQLVDSLKSFFHKIRQANSK